MYLNINYIENGTNNNNQKNMKNMKNYETKINTLRRDYYNGHI